MKLITIKKWRQSTDPKKIAEVWSPFIPLLNMKICNAQSDQEYLQLFINKMSKQPKVKQVRFIF